MAYTFKHGDRPLEGITVQRAVGRGGFGEVYYALADSGKQVALKYLRENPEIELRGIRHVMNLKSPHLITIYDVRTNDAGDPFVIMEYVSGPSLREMLLAEGNGMPAQKAAFLLSGIAQGLSYLHERGIVHRDLKPANIFYDDGYVKIGDYGLSKHISVSKHSGQTVSVGTVHYMAPEIGSGSYTKAIDIYALGVILYEMLTGRLPFSGSSMGEILMRHLRDDPDLSGISTPFARVIAKALAKDPADRYQDANEMLAAMMESADLSAGVASFDASALTQIPRTAETDDPDQTLTSPVRPPPLPPLDARERPRDGLRQYVAQARAELEGVASELPPRLQQRIDRLTRRIEQKADRLGRRFGQPYSRRHAPHADGTPRINRKPQMVILLAVTVMVAVVMGLLGGSRNVEERIVVLAFYIIGGTIGPLLAHLRLLRNSLTRNTVIDRLAYASMAGLFMLPAMGLASEELHSTNYSHLIVAPMAVLLLCNWTRRLEAGRRGVVDGWAVFWPAVIGAIAMPIVDAEECWWVAAGICATMSLVTQAAAAMWPHPRGTAPRPVGLPGPGALPQQPTAPQPPSAPDTPRAAHTTPDDTNPAAQTPSAPPALHHPSFVGRTANAGVSFLGKLLLLAGVVLAFSHGVLCERLLQEHGRSMPPELVWRLREGVPSGLLLAPVAIGSLLLVLARRRDGGAHFMRACVGCVLTLFGALTAINRVDYAGISLPWEHNPGLPPLGFPLRDIFSALVPMAIGIILLMWPKQKRDRPIVI